MPISFPNESSFAANFWNYNDKNKDGYSTALSGDVVEVAKVPATKQGKPGEPRVPDLWPDGNPKMNFRMTVKDSEGQLWAFVFTPVGIINWDKHEPNSRGFINVLWDALIAVGIEKPLAYGDKMRRRMPDVSDVNITIQTADGTYSNANPRPWWVTINGKRQWSEECKVVDEMPEKIQAPQPTAQPQNQYVPQPQPQQPQYAPQMQPPMQPQYAPQQQYNPQPPMQQQYIPTAAIKDPRIAAVADRHLPQYLQNNQGYPPYSNEDIPF